MVNNNPFVIQEAMGMRNAYQSYIWSYSLNVVNMKVLHNCFGNGACLTNTYLGTKYIIS